MLEQPQSPISPMLEDAREKMELRKRQEREHQNLRECQLREEAIAKQKEMQQNAQLLVSLMKVRLHVDLIVLIVYSIGKARNNQDIWKMSKSL